MLNPAFPNLHFDNFNFKLYRLSLAEIFTSTYTYATGQTCQVYIIK